MRRFDDVRQVRWIDGWLSIEGSDGELARVPVGADDLVLFGFGFRLARGLRYLAARFPAGTAAFLERRGRRSALAVRVRKAG